MEEKKALVDLGIANLWGRDYEPTEVVACREAGHVLKQHKEDTHVRVYTCPICGYKYRVDSSG